MSREVMRPRPDNAQFVDELYRLNRGRLIRVATGLVGAQAASDLLSTVLVKSLSARKGLVDVDDPLAYLYRSLFNESKKFYRRASRFGGGLDQAERDLSTPDSTDSVNDSLRVERALLSLSPRQRAVCVLTYWEDMAVSDIAQILQISQGSVKKHLARSRARMKKELSKNDI